MLMSHIFWGFLFCFWAHRLMECYPSDAASQLVDELNPSPAPCAGGRDRRTQGRGIGRGADGEPVTMLTQTRDPDVDLELMDGMHSRR